MNDLSANVSVVPFFANMRRHHEESRVALVHAFGAQCVLRAGAWGGRGSRFSSLLILPLSVFLAQLEGLGNVLFLYHIGLLKMNLSRQLTA